MRSWLWLIGSAVVLLQACWVDDNLPTPVGEQCNNNGRCELVGGESCQGCPADCPCCRVVEVKGSGIQNPELATGDGDGQTAQLAPGAVATLTVGREIFNEAGSDLLLVGQVVTASTVSLNSKGCPVVGPTGDSFRVEAGPSSSGPWDLLGFWTQSTIPEQTGQGAPFDLACGTVGLPAARYIRLSSLRNAAAQLDAVVATSCVE